jgi:hypothetical protein
MELCLTNNIELMEGVQRTDTKMTDTLKNKTYDERLKISELTTLEIRRTRGDLIGLRRLKFQKNL